MDCAYPLLLFKEEEDDLLLFVVVAARKSATEEDVVEEEEEEEANIIRKARTREWVEMCAWCVVFLAFKFEDYSSDALFFILLFSVCGLSRVLLTRPLLPRRSERFCGYNSSEEKHRRYYRRTRRAKGAKEMKRTCVLSILCHGVTSSSIRF